MLRLALRVLRPLSQPSAVPLGAARAHDMADAMEVDTEPAVAAAAATEEPATEEPATAAKEDPSPAGASKEGATADGGAEDVAAEGDGDGDEDSEGEEDEYEVEKVCFACPLAPPLRCSSC